MDTAYGNIGLEANTTWRDAPGDAFQKFSDNLWVKLNYLKERKHHQVGEKGKVVTVRDVIPQSKLARYGHYLYDNGREMMYNREKPFQFLDERIRSRPEEFQEPWMLSDVENEFKRLTRNCSQPYDLYYGFKPVDCVQVEESIQEKYPVLAKKCQPHDIDADEILETIRLPNPFYKIDDLNQLELQMRITSTKHIWENPVKSLLYLMNSQKYIQQFRRSPFSDVQFSAERNGLSAFPRSPTPTPSSLSLEPIVSPSFLPDPRHSGRLSSKTSQTTDSKDILPTVKKRSAESRDFANLTLLTRPINRREIPAPDHSSFQVPDSVFKWLQTGYPTRSRELTAIQSLSDELRNVRYSLLGSSLGNSKDRHGKCSDESFEGKKIASSFETNALTGLKHFAGQRNENQSASLSSSSSSEQNRSLGAKLAKAKYRTVDVGSKAVQSTGSSNVWQVQEGSPWSLKPTPLYEALSSDANPTKERGIQKGAANIKYRPILNSQYREGTDEEEILYGGVKGKKGSSIGGMADAKTFERNAFDDLERQAIEQWPSDDSVDIFRSYHLQSAVNNRLGRMTTKLRHHPQAAPLRIVVAKTNSSTEKGGDAAKRKSAVQMLQETKAFYVKSETVLDKKQEFKPGRDTLYGIPFQTSQRDTKLQDRLRLLLDFDAVENRSVRRPGEENDRGPKSLDQNICFQHKSLPDLHFSSSCSSSETSDFSFNIKCDGDSRSAYSSMTQPITLENSSPEKCKRCFRRSVGHKNGGGQSRSRLYASFRVAKSGEFVDSKIGERHPHRRRRSYASSCNRSRHNSSSKHSQSADSGRRSQGGSFGLRTGRSGLPEFPSPPTCPAKTVWTDSGTEDDFHPLQRSESLAVDKKRAAIQRSKSDVSGKSFVFQEKDKMCSSVPSASTSLQIIEKLEFFFDHLGMDPLDFKELASNNSGNSCSPVYLSSVSSMDSCGDATGWDVVEPSKQTDHPSIVERNARIIKWLYNCRKFQKPVSNEEKSTVES